MTIKTQKVGNAQAPGVNTLAGAATSCFATITPAVIQTARRSASSRSLPVPSDITATCVNFDGLAWHHPQIPTTLFCSSIQTADTISSLYLTS